jgi:GST-like protein
MVFIPANIYPCITLYDFPERFVKVPPSHSQAQVPADIVYGWAGEQGRENMKKMFGVLEGLVFCSDSGGAGGETPYAVGSASPTLADVYISMIAHYAPRPRFVPPLLVISFLKS